MKLRSLTLDPGECTPEYHHGWSFGDLWCSIADADLNADAAPHWSDEYAVGFWDRLRFQKSIRLGQGGPCSGCRTYTKRRDLGSGGPWRCDSDDCVMF